MLRDSGITVFGRLNINKTISKEDIIKANMIDIRNNNNGFEIDFNIIWEDWSGIIKNWRFIS